MSVATDFCRADRVDALNVLFTSTARAKILRLFMLDPLRAYYQRQIEAATGLAIRSVQRELERLTSISLLHRRLEGNRTYYQVDTQFPLFPEIRRMVLKTATPEEYVRGSVAVDESVRMAFLSGADERVLLVTNGEAPTGLDPGSPLDVQTMTSTEFEDALSRRAPSLEPFLAQGKDLLGRREDMMWRRIEAAGYTVAKGEGVA